MDRSKNLGHLCLARGGLKLSQSIPCDLQDALLGFVKAVANLAT